MDLSFQSGVDHLRIVCEGMWDPVDVTDAIREIRSRADALGRHRLLIDWTRVAAPRHEQYKALAGEDAARLLHPPFRIAVLTRSGQVTKLAERVATAGGAQVFVHFDETLLLRWLLDDAG